MSRNLCIIPARGGSKRIPRKNIKSFMGKPIIAYSIDVALSCGLFEEVMVSTDDMEIAEIGLKYGATVPFMRSKKNADDFSTTVEVLLEVLRKYRILGKHFDNLCCIYPTAAFVTKEQLIEAHQILLKDNVDVVFPVIPYSYPIQRSLKVKNNRLQFFFPEFENLQSQNLETSYHDAGQFYFISSESLSQSPSLVSNNCKGIVINEMEAQDINEEIDWRMAELKFKLMNEK